MKVAVIGGGFTGLSAGYYLSRNKHQVTIFEKEKELGGLSSTFKIAGWKWNLEKHYHHWFTNDTYALQLIKDLGLSDKIIKPKPLTSIYLDGKTYPFNSPFHVLSFTPLSLLQRFRTGFVLLYLKLLAQSKAIELEKHTAQDWLRKNFGREITSILWEPLLAGKFSLFKDKINMAWFWARIKKRTPVLLYMEGGYQALLEKLSAKIKKGGGKIFLETMFEKNLIKQFDRIIFTIPSKSFLTIFPEADNDYKERLSCIPHLHALNLIVMTDQKILKDTYWLNINEPGFPFLGIIQHTNMIDPKYYNGKQIAYIANYLPSGHPYLKMSKEELFDIYKPFLKKINPHLNLQPTTYNLQLFNAPFAQPVMLVNYSLLKPNFKTPFDNIYLANMDMVYPWDRGTNYAIELGKKIAEQLS